MFLVRSLDCPRKAWLHYVVDDDIDCGHKLRIEFEDFREDEQLEVCLREEAEAEVVFVTITEPTHLSGEAAVVALMRRMDEAACIANVSYGFVRKFH
jgi:hypothetical protein